MIIAKLIGVRYPRSITDGKKSEVSNIDNKEDIQKYIRDHLFSQDYDYCVIKYDNELFITEKDTNSTWTRRTVIYHPLASLLNM